MNTAQRLQEIAYHEAGHVVVGYACGKQLGRVWVREGEGGLTIWTTGQKMLLPSGLNDQERERAVAAVVSFAQAAAAYAGPVAEGMLLRKPFGANREDVTLMLVHVTRLAVLWPRLSPQAWMQKTEGHATALLRRHWPAVEAVAQALQERGELTASEAAEILQQAGCHPPTAPLPFFAHPAPAGKPPLPHVGQI